MLVGAHCRDVLQLAGGFDQDGGATHDIDLAIQAESLEAYNRIALGLLKAGDSGIRFRVSHEIVDLVPFGDAENPKTRMARPPRGPDTLNVRYYLEAFEHSLVLPLPSDTPPIRIPRLEGYVLLKLQAYADRAQFHRYKDLEDLILILGWLEDTWQDAKLDTNLISAAFNRYGDDFDIASLPAIDLATRVLQLAGGDLSELLMALPNNSNPQVEKVLNRGQLVGQELLSNSAINWRIFVDNLESPLQQP